MDVVPKHVQCALTCADGFADTMQVKLCEDPSRREEGGTAGERDVTGGTGEGESGGRRKEGRRTGGWGSKLLRMVEIRV